MHSGVNSAFAALGYSLAIQTGDNVPRELIKRWNVTNGTGLALINIFKTLNADSTISWASFAVKPRPLVCIVFSQEIGRDVWLDGGGRGMLGARKGLLIIFCKRPPSHPPERYPIHLTYKML